MAAPISDTQMLEPSSVIYMIVGPHSGFSLDEILEMKKAEELRLGRFYWGYAGSLCHPPKVQDFARQSISRIGEAPKVVMVATMSQYHSKSVGVLGRFSIDGEKYDGIEEGVTLIGCTIAVTCTNLNRCAASIDLNRYRVANGLREGVPMGSYIRYQINKACAFLVPEAPELPPRIVSVVATADLVEPFCGYLSE
jgi:hypothetical protein